MLTSPSAVADEPLGTVDYQSAPPQPTLIQPVSDTERIAAIDVARGLAILGIFLVNIQFFAQPFGSFMTLQPPPGSGALDTAVYYFTAIFCSGKFYPLFSTLFGIGFAIQFDRARRAGRPFGGLYLRRLAALFVFGVIHGYLLWYGDILLLYSIAGLILFGVLMLAPNVSWRVLLGIGVGLIFFAIILGAGINLLMIAASGGEGMAKPTPAEIVEAQAQAEAASSPIARLFQGFEDQEIEAPYDPLWMALETRAYRDGPYLQALAFRAMTYTMGLAFMVVGFGEHVLGMFFIGAALMRAGFFSADKRHWHRRLLLLGLLAGLPLCTVAAIVPGASNQPAIAVIAASLNMLGGPMMSLAYLSAITLVVLAGRGAAVTGPVAGVGRTALTCYLSSTVVATFLMYHWGLGMFGSLSPVQQVGVVLAIYAGLLVFANLWLRFFRFGPMEWLWRTITYLRRQPLVRR